MNNFDDIDNLFEPIELTKEEYEGMTDGERGQYIGEKQVKIIKKED